MGSHFCRWSSFANLTRASKLIRKWKKGLQMCADRQTFGTVTVRETYTLLISLTDRAGAKHSLVNHVADHVVDGQVGRSGNISIGKSFENDCSIRTANPAGISHSARVYCKLMQSRFQAGSEDRYLR